MKLKTYCNDFVQFLFELSSPSALELKHKENAIMQVVFGLMTSPAANQLSALLDNAIWMSLVAKGVAESFCVSVLCLSVCVSVSLCLWLAVCV